MNNNINLLPVELRYGPGGDIRGVGKKFFLMLALWGIIVGYLGFTAWMLFEQRQLRQLENELSDLKPRYEKVRHLEEENKRLAMEIKEFKKIQKDRANWTDIFQAINNNLPQDIWITSFSTNQGKIEVKGMAANLATIGVFLYQLNQLPYFSSFSLDKATEVKVGQNLQTEFSLVGTLVKEE